MEDLLIVSASPHIRHKRTTSRVMLDVILALLPALGMAVYLFGPRALVLTVFCVTVCLALEYAFCLVVKKPSTINDLSAVVTGILLAFNLPVSFPLWMAAIGCAAAIVVAKQLFGGLGENFANPAIVGRVVLMVSFTAQMSNYTTPFLYQKTGQVVDAVTSATPLAQLGSEQAPGYLDLFLGLHAGAMGEVCAAALLLGGLYLVLRRVISPLIPVCYIGTVFLLTTLCGADGVYHILSGGLMLGAIFMATDYVTSPMTRLGKVIFAVGCGLITAVIRLFGSYPEGVSFAILLMNILTPTIDRLVRTHPVGGVRG